MSTAYGLKYQVTYQNKDNGSTGRLRIYEDGYSSATSVYRSEAPAIRVVWGDEANDPMKPVVGSYLVATIHDRNATIFDDLEDADEQDFWAILDVDDGGGYDEWFRGWVRLDVSERGTDENEGFTQIAIVDGLKSLEDVAWKDSAGDLFDNDVNLLDVVCDILQRIDVSDDSSLSPLQLYTDVDLFDTEMSADEDPLAELQVDASMFTRVVRRGRGDEVEPFSCYEVLENICRVLSCQIMQVRGAWMLADPFNRMGASITVHKYDLDGTNDPSDPTDTWTSRVSVSDLGSESLSGGRRGSIRPLLESRLLFEHEPLNPMLLSVRNQSIDSGDYDQTGGIASGGEGRRVHFRGKIWLDAAVTPVTDHQTYEVPVTLKLGSKYIKQDGTIQDADPGEYYLVEKGAGYREVDVISDEIPSGNYAVYFKIEYPTELSLDQDQNPASDLDKCVFECWVRYEWDEGYQGDSATLYTTTNSGVARGRDEEYKVVLADHITGFAGLRIEDSTTRTTEWAETTPPSGSGVNLLQLATERRIRAFKQRVRTYSITLHDDSIPPPGGSVLYSGNNYLLVWRSEDLVTNTAQCMLAGLHESDGSKTATIETRSRERGNVPELLIAEVQLGAEDPGDGYKLLVRIRCNRSSRSILYVVSTSDTHPDFNSGTDVDLDSNGFVQFELAGPYDYSTTQYFHVKPYSETDASGQAGRWRFTTVQIPAASGEVYLVYTNDPYLWALDTGSFTTGEQGEATLDISGANDVRPKYDLYEGTPLLGIPVGGTSVYEVTLDKDWTHDRDSDTVRIVIGQSPDTTFSNGMWLFANVSASQWFALQEQVNRIDYQNHQEQSAEPTGSQRASLTDAEQNIATSLKLKDLPVGRFFTLDTETQTELIGSISEVDRTNNLAHMTLNDGSEYTLPLTLVSSGSTPDDAGATARAFDDLVEFWSLTDGPGDETGLHNGYVMTENATSGGIGTANFINGAARNFDASNNEFLSSADTSGRYPSLDEDFWFSVWVRPDSVSVNQTIVGKGEAAYGNSEWYLFVLSTDNTVRFVTMDTGGAFNAANSTVSLTLDQICNIQCWWDASTQTASISVDNAAQVDSVEANTPQSGSDPLYIGSRGTATYFDGSIRAFSLWKRLPDSAAERTYHYNNGVPLPFRAFTDYVTYEAVESTTTYTLAAEADQGYEIGTGAVSTTRTKTTASESYRFGHNSGGGGSSDYVAHYFRFDNLDIDDETDYTKVELRLAGGYWSSDAGLSYSWTWYGNDVDDAPQLSGSSTEITSMTTTTASVTQSGSDNWNPQESRDLDVTDIFDEVCARGGWANGNAVGLIMTCTSSPGNERQVCTFYENENYSPRIIVYKQSQTAPDAGTGASVDYTLTASAQDANCTDPDGCDLDDTTIQMGSAWGSSVGVVYIPSLGIPQGATIDNARLELEAAATDSGSFEIDVFCVLEASTTLPTDGENIWLRPRTSQGVRWADSNGWTSGDKYYTPSLSSVVQEVVNLPGWSTSSGLMILLGPAVRTGEREAAAYDHATGTAPRFVCNYTYTAPPSVSNPTTWVPSWDDDPSDPFISQFYDTSTPANSAIPLYYPSEMTWNGKNVAGDYVFVSKQHPQAEYTTLMDAVRNVNNSPPGLTSSLYPIERTRLIVVDGTGGDLYYLNPDFAFPEPPSGVGGVPLILAGDSPTRATYIDSGLVTSADVPAGYPEVNITDCKSLVTNLSFSNFSYWRMWGNSSIFLNLEYQNTWGDLHMFQSGATASVHGNHPGQCAVVGVAAYKNHNRINSNGAPKNVGQHLVYAENAYNETFPNLVVCHNMAAMFSGALIQLAIQPRYGTPVFDNGSFQDTYVCNNLGWETLRLFQSWNSGVSDVHVDYNTWVASDNFETLIESLYACNLSGYLEDECRAVVWHNIADGNFNRNIIVHHQDTTAKILTAYGPSGDDYPSGSVDYNHFLTESSAQYSRGTSKTWYSLDATFNTTWRGTNGTVNSAPSGATDPDDIAASDWTSHPFNEVDDLRTELDSEVSSTEGFGVICEVGPKWRHSDFGF